MSEFFARILFQLLFWVLLLPVLLMLCTPFLLITSCFGQGSYGDKLKAGYGKVFGFWGQIL